MLGHASTSYDGAGSMYGILSLMTSFSTGRGCSEREGEKEIRQGYEKMHYEANRLHGIL